MLPRHFKMMDLQLAGYDRKNIAEILGITTQTVSNVSQSPLYIDEIARRRGSITRASDEQLASTPARAKAVLDCKSVAAAEKLGLLIDSFDESIAHRASVAILDKVLGGDHNSIRPITINAEQLQLLQVSLKESQVIKDVG